MTTAHRSCRAGALTAAWITRHGRRVEAGTLADMRHLTRTSIDAVVKESPAGLKGLVGVHGLRVDGGRVRCEVDTDELDGVLGRLTALGLRSLVSQPPTLEDLFLRHYATDGESSGDSGQGAGVGAAR